MESFDICFRLFSSLVSCRVMSCHVVYCPILSCPVLSCRVLFCRVLPCRVLSSPVVPYFVLSCRVVSHSVVSCPVLSCPILFSLVLSCSNKLVADILIIAYVIQNFVRCNHVSQDAFYKKLNSRVFELFFILSET